LTGGAVWGVLEVDSSIQRDFSEDTTEFMIAAAAVIASSVQLKRRIEARRPR
jgi:putative methionine-R-sulfoxide reductase with GAF domain